MKIGKYLLPGLALFLTTSWKPAESPPTVSYVRQLDIRWYDGGPHPTTSNGEIFIPTALTYASKWDIIGTVAKVEWEGREVIVRCNDRGPNQCELTWGAFKRLADPDIGVLRKAKVTIIK